MALSPGTRLGAYEITDALGAGGMGEVYRARDTKLGRSVAVKILPDALAADPERIARFEREAKMLAALNHPHIAALYGMEHDGSRHFLIMELVEGETLSERLHRGALPIEEALSIAHQIVEALEAAHEKGIIHRDLKPANVKVTPDDNVKVLDFGLAKAMTDAGEGFQAVPGQISPVAATHSPTLSMMATQAGVILGTAAYMSPEQAKGLPADHRSDVFSFGCVLYEMLTGRQPFQGETAPDVLASVLVRDPDLHALPPNLNPRLTDLLRRCLEKQPRRRWQAVGDLRAEIEAIATAPRAVPAAQLVVGPPRPLWKRAIPLAAAAIVASFITGAVMWISRPSALPAVVARFPVTLPEGQQLSTVARNGIAISRDGTQLAYVASGQLYLRRMSDLEGMPITGADQGNVANPVFSPDGRSIAFYTPTGRAIKRMAVSGGAAVTITPTDGAPLGMSWDADGILFVDNIVQDVFRVAANGGKPERVVDVKDGENAYGPEMLPDREHVLFTVAAGRTPDEWDKARIVVESLRSHERKIVFEGGSDARFLPTGHLVYAVAGVLFALPFDVRRLEVAGGPTPILEGVRRARNVAAAFFGVSDTGTLIYAPGPVSGSSAGLDVGLIDRSGIPRPLRLPPAVYEFPRVSPDGKHIAVHADDGKDANVWIYELSGATSARRLTNGGRNRFPVWSADSQRVAFQSDREGDLGIFWQPADGSGTAARLTKPDKDTAHVPESWSPDGKRLLFAVTKGSTNTLGTLSPQDNKVVQFGDVQSIFLPSASFSPDGRWVAYTVATSTNDISVFVQPFPSTGSKYLITATGIHPFWSPDGKELFYRWRGQTFAVGVRTQPTFALGNAMPVAGPFRERGPQFEREVDITRDGKQFVSVVARETGSSATTSGVQLQIVLNWFEELKQRVPAR